MDRSWSEAEATCTRPCAPCADWSEGWSGGNFAPEPSATVRVAGAGWYSWEVTGDIRRILQGAPNHGWFLKAAQTAGPNWTSASFFSRAAAPEEIRPYLRVRLK